MLALQTLLDNLIMYNKGTLKYRIYLINFILLTNKCYDSPIIKKLSVLKIPKNNKINTSQPFLHKRNLNPIKKVIQGNRQKDVYTNSAIISQS